MKLILERIIAEFNKIYKGVKRVGDSAKLGGKKENELDVYNASLLGYKSEADLKVKHSKSSDKADKILAVNENGDVVLDTNGNPVYKTENQLSVLTSQLLQGKEPKDLEVDIANRIKIVSDIKTRIIEPVEIFNNIDTLQVKDSKKLNSKYEEDLEVKHAKKADDAQTLNGRTEDQFNVNSAKYADKLKRPDGTLVSEEELIVHSAFYIKKGTSEYDLYGLKKYILESDAAKDVIPHLAEASQSLTTDNGNKSWKELKKELKEDENSEVYKASHIITSDNNSPNKTGDELKTWIINSNDFSDKVGTLNANTANRALKIGTASENYTITELKDLIKKTTVDLADNANKLNGKTAEDIISTTRYRILTNSSDSNTGLTQDEVDGFFGNNKVKLAVQKIKVDNASNSDKLNGKTKDEIKSEIKNEGGVYSSKYLIKDLTTGGLVSYKDIQQDISDMYDTIKGGASSAFDTLGEIEENFNNLSDKLNDAIEKEKEERISADDDLKSQINTQKSRIDTIVSTDNSDDPKTFKDMKNYVDNADNDLLSKINKNAEDIANIKADSTVEGLKDELDETQKGAGLNDDGTYSANSDTNYLTNAKSLKDADEILDAELHTEKINRINGDNVLNDKINDLKTDLNDEINRAKSAEGDLNNLNTDNKDDLVSAINEVIADLNNEIDNRINGDNNLKDEIDTLQSNLNNEINRAKSTEGDLDDLQTNKKDNLVEAINDTLSQLNDEINRAKSAEGDLTQLKTNDTSSLTNAINELKNDIIDEQNNRKNADDALNSSISELKSDLDDEIQRAKSVEGDLNDLQTDNKNDLVGAINDNYSKIQQEISERTNADTNIQNDLNSKYGTIKGAIGNLDETNNAVKFENTNYLDDKTTISDAFIEVDARIKSNSNIISNIGADLQSQIDNEVQRAKSVEGNLDDLQTENKDNLVSAINSEVSRAKSKEDELQSEIDNLNTDLLTNYFNKTTDEDQIISPNAIFNNNVVIKGNLTIEGSQTEIETEVLKVKDNIITLNDGIAEDDEPTSDAGIEVNRGKEGILTFLKWNETNDRVEIYDTDLQDLDEVAGKTYVNNIQSNLQSQIDNEVQRAKSVEGNLDDLQTENKDNLVSAINSEVNRAKSREDEIQSNLDDEIQRAKSTEGNLDDLQTENKDSLVNAINSEVNRATSKENEIQTNLDNEIQRAKSVEGNLDDLQTENKDNLVSAINSEVDRAKSKENEIQTNLDNEIQRAKNAEGSLEFDESLNTTDDDGNTITPSDLTDAINKENQRAREVEDTKIDKRGNYYTNAILNSDNDYDDIYAGIRYYVDVSDDKSLDLYIDKNTETFDKVYIYPYKGDVTSNTITLHLNNLNHSFEGDESTFEINQKQKYEFVLIDNVWYRVIE